MRLEGVQRTYTHEMYVCVTQENLAEENLADCQTAATPACTYYGTSIDPDNRKRLLYHSVPAGHRSPASSGRGGYTAYPHRPVRDSGGLGGK